LLREIDLDKLRFGLVGLGYHGIRYARHLINDIHEGDLVAVCRRDKAEGEAFAREHGLEYYADAPSLCVDPAVDAVIVVTPPSTHMEISLQAIREGKHLVVEKPMARSVEEATAIADGAEQAGMKAMVAHTMRYSSVAVELKKALGLLGTPKLIRIAMRLEPSGQPWHSSPEVAGGGVLIDLGVHIFDLVRFLSGDEVRIVKCAIENVKNPDTEDFFAATLELASSGAICHVDANRLASARTGLIDVVGEKGEARVDLYTGSFRLCAGGSVEERVLSAGAPAIVRMIEAFIRSVRNGHPVEITPRDGVESIRIVEACYRSASDRAEKAVAPIR